MIDDVISQGREPEPGLKPSLSRRWRVAAGTLAVVAAGLAVIGVGLRHGTGSLGTPAATASGSTGADGGAATGNGETGADGGAQRAPFVAAPAPQNHPALAICAPSTGVCSMRGARHIAEVRINAGTPGGQGVVRLTQGTAGSG